MKAKIFLAAGLASLSAACGAPSTRTPDQPAVVRVHEITADRSTPEGRVATFANCIAVTTADSASRIDTPDVSYMPATDTDRGMAQVIVGSSLRDTAYYDDLFRFRFGADGRVSLYAVEAYNDLYQAEGAVKSCADAAGITAPAEGVAVTTRNSLLGRSRTLDMPDITG